MTDKVWILGFKCFFNEGYAAILILTSKAFKKFGSLEYTYTIFLFLPCFSVSVTLKFEFGSLHLTLFLDSSTDKALSNGIDFDGFLSSIFLN